MIKFYFNIIPMRRLDLNNVPISLEILGAKALLVHNTCGNNIIYMFKDVLWLHKLGL